MILTEVCCDLPSWYQTTVPCLVKNASVVASTAAAVVAAAPSFRFAARHSIGVATWEFVARAVHSNNWKSTTQCCRVEKLRNPYFNTSQGPSLSPFIRTVLNRRKSDSNFWQFSKLIKSEHYVVICVSDSEVLHRDDSTKIETLLKKDV